MSKKKKKADVDKENKILLAARKRYVMARKVDKTERKLADEDTRFAIDDEGCQWPKEVRTARESLKPPRPCLVMNKIPEKIASVEGEFQQLRPSIKVKPVDSQADPKIAKIFGGLMRHIEYNSNARAAYNTSHSCVLHGGRGAWRVNIVNDQDDPFEQDLEIGRIPNPQSITWDPFAKKIDRSDGRFLFIEDIIPEDDVKRDYGEINLGDWPTEDETVWRTDDGLLVCEYWWIEDKDMVFHRVEREGTEITVREDKLREEDVPIADKSMTALVPKVYWCKMIANKILEGPYDDWPGKYIPIILEFGKEVNVGGKAKTRGMVRFGKEPQRMYNYFTSSEAEQIALAPKAPYLVTPSMVKGHENQWESMNTQNYAYMLFNPDSAMAGQGPKREAPPLLSQAMVVAKQGMEHDIMSAMNVYAASLGDQGSEVSGKAIDSRTRQGSIGAYGYTDNFENSLLHSAKVVVDLIPSVYNTEKIVRIRGESDDEKMVAINARPDSDIMQRPGIDKDLQTVTDHSEYINDLSIGKYDIVATIGPAYTTQREEALEKMIRIFELMPNLAAAAPDLIIGLMDIPMSEALLDRAKKLVPDGMRELDPGEEPPAEQPPSTEDMIKMKEVELKFMEQMRKDFEAGVNSLKTIAEAEAVERGQQFNEYMAKMQIMVDTVQQRQQPAAPNQIPGG